MKLICRKCGKEIEDFSIKYGADNSGTYHQINVSCHGDVRFRRFNAKGPFFNTSHHGDIHFFEKDEAVLMQGQAPKKENWNPVKCQELFTAMVRRFEEDMLVKDEAEIGIATEHKDGNVTFDPPLKHYNYKYISLTPIEKDEHPSPGCTHDCQLLEIERNKYNRLLNENEGLKERIRRISLKPNEVKFKKDEAEWVCRDWHKCIYHQESHKKWAASLKPAPLTWSKAKPTEEGNWHFRDKHGKMIVPVHREGEELYLFSHACGGRCLIPEDSFKVSKWSNGEWAGPIPEPGDRKTCGNCVHWKGGWIKVGEDRRRCLYPLTEGETFVSFSGYSKADDTCSRWKPTEPVDLDNIRPGEVYEIKCPPIPDRVLNALGILEEWRDKVINQCR